MKRGQRSGLKSLAELVLTVAVAVGLALLIQAFVVKPYRIPSPSMVPTLAIGQRVLTNRLINHPSVGDIVVFHPPASDDRRFWRPVPDKWVIGVAFFTYWPPDRIGTL